MNNNLTTTKPTEKKQQTEDIKLLTKQRGVEEELSAIPQIGDSIMDSDMDVDDVADLNVETETEEFIAKIDVALQKENSTSKPSAGQEPTQSTSKSKKPKTREEKELSGYKSSRQFLRKMEAKDQNSLSERDKALIKKHTTAVVKFENKHPKEGNGTNVAKGSLPGTSGTKEQLRPIAIANRTSSSKVSSKVSGSQPAASSSKTTKRQRSGEVKQSTAPKKIKPSTSVENVPKDLQIGIIDRSQIDGSMSTERWLLVEAEILKALSEEIENSNSDCCNFANVGWSHGVKTIDCQDLSSKQFLEKTVNGLGELWTGASLEVITRETLPLCGIIKIWIPPPNVIDGERILSLLAAQNKDINMSKWKIKGEEASKNQLGSVLVIWADQESLRTLKEKSDILNFGLGKIHAKNNIHDGKERSNSASGSDKPAPL